MLAEHDGPLRGSIFWRIGFETEFSLSEQGLEGDGFPSPLSKQNYTSQNDMVVHAEGSILLRFSKGNAHDA